MKAQPAATASIDGSPDVASRVANFRSMACWIPLRGRRCPAPFAADCFQSGSLPETLDEALYRSWFYEGPLNRQPRFQSARAGLVGIIWVRKASFGCKGESRLRRLAL
jgi:hypothetical protein